MANMSFLPEDYLERRIQRRTNLISVSLFVVVMVGVVGAFLVSDRQRVDVKVLQDQVNLRYQDAAKRLEQLDQLQLRKQEMVRKAGVTAVLLERVPRSMLLAELINNMPSTLSLREFTLTSRVVKRVNNDRTALQKKKRKRNQEKLGPAVAEPDPTVVELNMVGLAPTDVQVAQFMTSLNHADMFARVNLAFSKEVQINGHLMREFRVLAELNPDVTVHEMEPKRVQRALKQNPMGNTIQIDPAGKLVIPADPEFDVDVTTASDTPQDSPALKD